MKKTYLLLVAVMAAHCLFAQDKVFQTFKDRWIINTHSVETLPKHKLDARIAHRFSDLAGTAGGWETFYGLENAMDVSFGAEYGIRDDLTVGFGRSKGAGRLRQLLNASLKYKAIAQSADGSPVTLAIVGMTSISTAKKSEDPSSLTYFEQFPHRMVHHGSVLIARKFSEKLSLQASGGITHRNVVPTGEENNIVHVGLAARLQITRTLGLIGDFALPFINEAQNAPKHYAPVGIGFEFDTGGHVFQLNFTNATGLMPTDYIPYTLSNWGDGQFRIGFTISRIFNL